MRLQNPVQEKHKADVARSDSHNFDEKGEKLFDASGSTIAQSRRGSADLLKANQEKKSSLAEYDEFE
jgi:hypothetical protein